jgi:tol-pal system beta propeller repeat protein TolB
MKRITEGSPSMKTWVRVWLAVAVAAGMLAAPGGAEAAFPGGNGWIAYERYSSDGTAADIYVMDGTGGNKTLLINVGNADLDPAWSPDGTKIAFSTDEDIWVANADGSNPVNLTNTPITVGSDREPAWSPDGRKIVFSSIRPEGDTSNLDIYVIDASGGNEQRLTTDPDTDRAPAWSPDGATIAFCTNRDGAWIYLMNPDGSGERPLRQFTHIVTDPNWSPNGQTLVIAGDANNPGIRLLDLQGNLSGALTEGPIDRTPAWSPRGTAIVFTHYVPGSGNREIYTVNPDGSGQTNLTNTSLPEYDPDWMPLQVPRPRPKAR